MEVVKNTLPNQIFWNVSQNSLKGRTLIQNHRIDGQDSNNVGYVLDEQTKPIFCPVEPWNDWSELMSFHVGFTTCGRYSRPGQSIPRHLDSSPRKDSIR